MPTPIAAMGRHGHLALDAAVRARLETISAATIDRALRPARSHVSGRRRWTASLPSIRRAVPIRTHADRGDPAPGFVEACLVAHSGPRAGGGFVQTLVLSDIASGWTGCGPLPSCEQRLLGEVMTVVREGMPFPLLGLDTGTVFIDETIKARCEAAGVAFTRSRPRPARTTGPASSRGNGATVTELRPCCGRIDDALVARLPPLG